MANANNALKLSELDFTEIKNQLKDYLSDQDYFLDYNFEASGLSTILDVLAYNTHYNAYYLNMVANELFLDTAVTRSSVVSHAKLLNYVPKSSSCSKIWTTLYVHDYNQNLNETSKLLLKRGTRLLSEAIDGVPYIFSSVTDVYSVYLTFGWVYFSFWAYEGEILSFDFPVDLISNPTSTFKLPNINVDTTTLEVKVFENNTSTSYITYSLASDFLELNPESEVYFLQESFDGYYEIYFGDGILGKSLKSGNVVSVSYLATNGDKADGASYFTLVDNSIIDIKTGNPFDYGYVSLFTSGSSSGGSDKESIESIKFSAPLAYSAQKRAVTKEDFSYLIKNDPMISATSVTVWGGEENTPPEFGKVFFSLVRERKQNGSVASKVKDTNLAPQYSFSRSEKIEIVNRVKQYSIVSVIPELVDVDYTFLKITNEVVFDKKRTTLTQGQLSNVIRENIVNFVSENLTQFDSIFRLSDLMLYIKNSDNSIIANEFSLMLQKVIYPQLNINLNYVLDFNTELKRDGFNKVVSTYPAVQQYISGKATTVDMFFEEDSTNTSSIETISMLAFGSGYTSTPTVNIYGDGIGAKAYAVINSGEVTEIILEQVGSGYTQVNVVISGGGGSGAKAVATLQTNVANIYSYYFDEFGTKIKVNSTAGFINFKEGKVQFNDLSIVGIRDSIVGAFTVSVVPKTSLIKSTKNKILTLNYVDPTSITVNVTEK